MEADRCNPAKRMRRNTRLDKLVPFILSLLMPILACAPAAVAARHAAEGKVPAARASGAKENLRTDSKAQSPAQPFSVKGLKDTEGLVLKQEYRFIGKCTTYFSPLGISVESNSLSILFNAKTQNLCVYSDDTKKYYACDPETWKKKSKGAPCSAAISASERDTQPSSTSTVSTDASWLLRGSPSPIGSAAQSSSSRQR